MHPEIVRARDMKGQRIVLPAVTSDEDLKAIHGKRPMTGRALLRSFLWSRKAHLLRSNAVCDREPGVPVLDGLQPSNTFRNRGFAAVHFGQLLGNDLLPASSLLLAL